MGPGSILDLNGIPFYALIVAIDASATVVGGAITEIRQPGQIPGDCDQDGLFLLSDAICLLSKLFVGPPVFPCDVDGDHGGGHVTLLDGNGDGTVDVSDAIYSLASLFSGGGLPPAPHVDCGIDPTPDSLTCDDFGPCP